MKSGESVKCEVDERLTLIGLLLESVGEHIRKDVETEDYVTELHKLLKELKMVCERADRNRENIDTILGNISWPAQPPTGRKSAAAYCPPSGRRFSGRSF